MNRIKFDIVSCGVVRRGFLAPRSTWRPEIEILEQRLAPNAATIHWKDVHQQIDGFGASSASFENSMFAMEDATLMTAGTLAGTMALTPSGEWAAIVSTYKCTAAPVLIQEVSAASGPASSIVVSLPNAVGSGHAVIVGIRFGDVVANLTPSLSDSLNNNYHQDKTQDIPNDGDSIMVYSALNVNGGSCSLTISTGGVHDYRVIMREYSGLSLSSALDQTNSATASGTSVSSGNVTTTTATQLAICVSGNDNRDAYSYSPGTGFGHLNQKYIQTISDSQANLLFDQSTGIGLSLLRNQIAANDLSGTSYETGTMLKAQARGALVWSTPWSPPAAWKTNNSANNGGSLMPGHYEDYANLLANYVLNMKSQGINIYAVSIQNEPDLTANYASCIWTASQFHDFVAVLGPRFAALGVRAKIMIPEESGWHFSLASDTLNDPTTAQYVAIVGGHDYDGGVGAVPQATGKQLWETEVSDFGAFDPGMGSGLNYASQIHNFMTIAQANAWHYWWLQSANPDNEGLLGQSGQVTKRLYTLGNFSKFIRPGYFRIGVIDDGGVLISAYKNPTNGKFVIVAVNPGSDRIETFNLNGFTATSVTPWITSASLDLAQQTSISVSGSNFTHVLPAGSVTTFVGTLSNLSGPTVSGVTINDGSSQRSRVTSLTVTFNSEVTFVGGVVGGAFTLTRNGTGSVNFQATANVVNGVTVVTLNNFNGNETQFGSLRDGRYTLTALATQISNAAGPLNGGNNYIFGDAQGLFRMYGDFNGDRQVDGVDFSAFSSTYNLTSTHPNFLALFDINGDGVIDGFDFSQFSGRFNTLLP